MKRNLTSGSLLDQPWQLTFRAEMEAIGCRFPVDLIGGLCVGDTDIQVPENKMLEAREIIARYAVKDGAK